MKSFQNKSNMARSLQSKKCIHGRQSIKYIKNNQCSKSQLPTKPRQTPQYSHQLTKSTVEDPHTSMMKSLIAMNENYFQDKLQVPNDGKPSKLKLKIPSQTGFTIYKRDYVRNPHHQLKAQGIQAGFKENKIKPDFFGNTTYRNQFLGAQNDQRDNLAPKSKYVQSEAPILLQSQYKHNFLNWGSQSHMPSMKPHPNPAVTNLRFQPHTIYSTQFSKKPHSSAKTQNFNPNNHSKSPSPNKSNIISNKISTPLLFTTTNNVFYDRKNNCKQNDLKPKISTLTVSGNCFRGKTQYQSEFVNQKVLKCAQGRQKKPLEELQNMILNL